MQRIHPDRLTPSRFPNGWFAVAYAREVKRGAVVTTHVNGREVVVYRTASGRPCVVNSHCPHLGAHLGHGGAVSGEQIVCPFHHLRFGPDGRCTRADGGEPPNAVLHHWPVREWNGLLLVWADHAGVPPAWELPAMEMDGYSSARGVCHVLRGNLGNPAENGIDINHFGPLHGWSNPSLHAPTVDGHRMYMGAEMTVLGQPVRLDFTMHGLGCMAAEMWLSRIGLRARVILFPTQVDAGHWACRELVALRLEKAASWPSPARRLVNEVLVTAAYRLWFVPQFKRDLLIWDTRDYEQRPSLMPGEMPIVTFRRWTRQFYPKSFDEAPSPYADAEETADLPLHERAAEPVSSVAARR